METITALRHNSDSVERLQADQDYRYVAFISYRHTSGDRKFAKWLHGQIERYRSPGGLVKRGVRKRVGRVFRDEEELAASADLSKEIEQALEQSQYLIVICSRLTPESRWVNEEIKRFRSLGRGDRILALLIDGEPDEAFPAALIQGAGPDEGQTGEPREPLAADVRRSGDENERSLKYTAKLKIIATLLGCNYDDLRRREQERQRRLWAAGIFSLLALVAVISTLALLARYQRNVAVEQRQLAIARQLTAQSELIREQQPSLIEDSALLAVEAMKRFERLGVDSLEADQALRSVMALLPGNIVTLAYSDVISAVAYGSDGQLGAASAEGVVSVRDAAAGGTPGESSLANVNYRVFNSSDGARVAFASTQQPILWWQGDAAEKPGSQPRVATPDHIAFSADGNRFAFGSGKIVRIWDAKMNRDLTQIPVSMPLSKLAMNSSGDRIATVGFKPELQLFDVETGAPVSRLAPQGMESVEHISFGPAEAALLASVSKIRLDMFDHRYVVSLWDLSTEAVIRQVEFRSIVDEVLIGPRGEAMAVRIEDETVRILAIAQGRKDLILAHEGSVLSWVFGPTGRYLATLDKRGTVRVWDTISGREVSRIVRGSSVSAMAFSPDGRRLAIAAGKRVYVQDAVAMEEQARLNVDGSVRALDFNPRFEAIAIGVGDVGEEGAAHLWLPATGEQIPQRVDYNYSVEIALFSPDDAWLFTGSTDPVSCGSRAQLMNVAALIGKSQPSRLDLAEPIPDCLSSAAFSPDGEYILGAGYNDQVARIWETSSGKLMASLEHEEVVVALAWSPDSDGVIATAGADGIVRIWKDGNEVTSFGHGTGVTALAFGPDGQRLVSAGESGVAKVWDLENGVMLGSILHSERLLALAYSPDGRHVATAGRDNVARIWAEESRRTVAEMPHDAAVETLAFSPDGQHLASAATGGKVHVWTVPGGVEVSRSLYGNVSTVQFSSDGSRLLVGGYDGYVRVSLWRPADLVAEACSRLTRNLSPAIWQRLLGNEVYVATCHDSVEFYPGLQEKLPSSDFHIGTLEHKG